MGWPSTLNMRPRVAAPTGTWMGVAGGLYLHAPGQALAPGQHHAADGVVPHMLGHFHDPDGPVLLHGKGLTDAGQMPRLKLHVHHGT